MSSHGYSKCNCYERKEETDLREIGLMHDIFIYLFIQIQSGYGLTTLDMHEITSHQTFRNVQVKFEPLILSFFSTIRQLDLKYYAALVF